mgnify:CR=1 FL=1
MCELIKISERLPSKDGWYMVKYADEDRLFPMGFRVKKLSYSDSQFLTAKAVKFKDGKVIGADWQGRLPDYWVDILLE